MAFILIIILYILKLGNYPVAAHSLLIFAMFLIWLVIFLQLDTDIVLLDKIDTIVFIIGLLALTPFIISEKKWAIFLYAGGNGFKMKMGK